VTPEEIAEYNRLGKPYDVTTLKKETKLTPDTLVQGKVYYITEGGSVNFWLLKHGTPGYMYKQAYTASQFKLNTANYTYQEATPEQVKHFEACLKAGKYVEPDKVKEVEPWSVGTYVVFLVDIWKYKKGDIDTITITPKDNGGNMALTKDSYVSPIREVQGTIKWFATLPEAEEFAKTLTKTDEIPEYVECIILDSNLCTTKEEVIGNIYNF
jgi:hypothetical protein